MAATFAKPAGPVRRIMLLLACRQTAFLSGIKNQAWRPASCAAGRQSEFLTPAELECGRGYVVRRHEGNARWSRDRCRKRPQEWRATVIDFPTDQHGIVLVHCVVAVLHEHSTPVAELHGQGHASTRTQAIDVFAALFPSRNVSSATVAGKDLAFFKVDVDRVVPSAAAVLQSPDLTRSVTRSRGDTSPAGVQHLAIVGLYAPRTRLIARASGKRFFARRQRL